MKVNYEPFLKQYKENQVSGQFCSKVLLQFQTGKQSDKGANAQNKKNLELSILNSGQAYSAVLRQNSFKFECLEEKSHREMKKKKKKRKVCFFYILLFFS